MDHDATPANRVMGLADGQQGLVTRQQLLHIGITPRSVEGLVRRRWLRPVARGVYLVGPPSAPWWREMAVLLAHPAAVLSHWSAARLGRLVPADEMDRPDRMNRPGRAARADRAQWADRAQRADGDADVVWVIVPRGSSGRAPGVRALRTDHLHATEWRLVEGMRATTPARTLLDLAAVLGRMGQSRRLEQLVAMALDEKLCTSDDIVAIIQRHAGTRGAGLLRLVHGDDGNRPALSRSEGEELLRQGLLLGELPPWLQNTRAAGYEVDFLWRKERVVAEVDGYAWHSSRNRFERDRARDAALAAAGYLVLRFTWRQVERKPMAVVARIAYVLGRRSAG